MRSLFLKIFLWFWLTIIFATLATVVVTVLFPSQAFIVQAKNYFAFNLATTGKLGAGFYEKEGQRALNDFLSQIETISSFRLHFLSEDGIPLHSASLPEGAKALARDTVAETSPQFKNIMTHPLIAIKTVSDSGKAYVIILELPIGIAQYFFKLTQGHVLRLLSALLVSGAICFLFVRYLTTPIKKLQIAVRRFAQGDLQVRVSKQMGNRKDEIANLGKDFDVMAAQIETLMHAHERLLRDIAHELRSPLTRLNVALEITRKHTGEAAKHFIDRIGQEADKLSQLITQLLTLSRIENIDTMIKKSKVALEEIVSRIAQDAAFEGQGRDCRVTFDCRDQCQILAEGNIIRSAIENVVRNALRFAPIGSQVEIVQKIEKTQKGPVVEITVSDSGPGVAEEALDNLFRPFFRADHPQDRASGGAGLGLAIAYRAITLHQGQIHAKNRAQGGLSVQMRLPIAPMPARREIPNSINPKNGENHGPS